jgi:Spy/CpxP family protein refolding chaperone
MRAGNAKGSVVVRAILLTTVATLLFSGCVGQEGSSEIAVETSSEEAHSEQPYAGLEERSIKALSDEKIDGLLEGRGFGYALAGELNHYPGPRHVLDLAGQLDLTVEQEQTVQEIYSAMQEEVKPLGRELVDLEEQLDRAFRDEEIDEEELARLTDEIATIEGSLRNAHLNAHLKTKDILGPEQVAEYDRLRGYTEDASLGEGHSSRH